MTALFAVRLNDWLCKMHVFMIQEVLTIWKNKEVTHLVRQGNDHLLYIEKRPLLMMDVAF